MTPGWVRGFYPGFAVDFGLINSFFQVPQAYSLTLKRPLSEHNADNLAEGGSVFWFPGYISSPHSVIDRMRESEKSLHEVAVTTLRDCKLMAG